MLIKVEESGTHSSQQWWTFYAVQFYVNGANITHTADHGRI